MSSVPVKLYVYDLSQGMARSMSLQLTGKQIDGIWHTSVVVYGTEYFFGQGIMTSYPGRSHHGQPLEIIEIGETYLPKEVVTEYVQSLYSVYTADKYHLLDFNCNTFSNDLCQFLCGKTIPTHISELPAEFLRTPFGQSILPMIEGMFGQSKLNPAAATAAAAVTTATPPSLPSAEAASLIQGISSAATSAAPATLNPVQIARSASEVDSLISTYSAVVVFFTSATCPPCRIIKPDFEKLIADKNDKQDRIKLLGIVLDLSMASSDVAKFGVRATPTFHLYLHGKKYSEFQGANYAELKSQVDILLYEAYPPHPHRKVLLRTIIDLSNKPILYSNWEKTEMIYGKLEEFLKKKQITLNDNQKRSLEQTRQFVEKKTSQIDMNEWKSLVDDLLNKLSTDEYFPLLDIYRALMISHSDVYVHDPAQLATILDIASRNEHCNKATWIMVLRIACNIFFNPTLSTTHFTSDLPSSHRTQLTQLLVNSLLSPESRVRQIAASLAYNCSTVVAIERLKKEEGSFKGIAEQEDDDWQVELTSAIMDALIKETDEEIIHRLLAAISKFLFLAPQEVSSVAELLSALDMPTVIEEKKKVKLIRSTNVVGLARDICELLKQ
ncbi:MAG: PPPDE putative peptidase domain-containing protein [Benjaminiella poitrasii]|nr:MAG: PPPDE putative peptidase domain-containing protein [Benjaminiella poitrasii]